MKKSILSFLKTLMLIFSLALIISVSKVSAAELNSQYKLDVKFDEENKTFKVGETIKFENNYKGELKDIVLHLYADSYGKRETMPGFYKSFNDKQVDPLKPEEIGDIKIEKALLNKNNTKFTQDNQVLKIYPEKAIKNGENVEIYIEFSLKIPVGMDRLGYFNDIYSLTNWYPILSMYDDENKKWDENKFNTVGESNYSDIANYELSLEAPSNMIVASTGEKKDEKVNGKSKKIYVKAENVRDFVIIMSPKFKVVSKEVDGIKINNYYYDKPEVDSLKLANEFLDVEANAIVFFSKQFGKYPYSEFDMVETNFNGGAMEYPGIIQMPVYEERDFIKKAIVHEVGHQWWYVTVGNNEFKEPFLDESLTVFSTAYYFTKNKGKYDDYGIKSSLINYMEFSHLQQAKKVINSKVDEFEADKADFPNDYNTTIYVRGAIVFEDLRQKVGDKKFVEIMQSYLNKYKFKNATVDGLLQIIEEKSGKDIREYINTALNSEAYYPEDIKLSDEEQREIRKREIKDNLQGIEKENGIVMASLPLRILNKEDVCFVLPSNINEKDKLKIDDLVKSVKHTIEEYYKVKNIDAKKDVQITKEDIKNKNLILIGNPWDNTLYNNIQKDYPITLSKNGLYMKDLVINNDSINGMFIVPNDNNKVILNIFWNGDLIPNDLEEIFGIYRFEESQFVVNVNNTKRIMGKF